MTKSKRTAREIAAMEIKPIALRTVSMITKLEVNVTARQLIRLLNNALCDDEQIPEDAQVSVLIPGGGDWSSTDLDVTEDRPIEIRWSKQSTDISWRDKT